jgi:hypothetical protein
MITHLAGEKAPELRTTLNAPPKAAFANEIVTQGTNGERVVRWNYLAKDGSVIDYRQAGARRLRSAQSAVVRHDKEQVTTLNTAASISLRRAASLGSP